MQQPLRFKISNWQQLTQVQSNTSKKLHISVTDFLQSTRLNGLRITVEHEDLGVLFTYVLNASGSLITPYPNNEQQFSPAVILAELARFGFLVEYDVFRHLSSTQLQFLDTLRKLNFDKIRVLNVWDSSSGIKQFSTHIVAFQISQHGDWINNGYAPSTSEYTQGLVNGSAMDISAVSREQHMDWSWLVGWVADIADILIANQENT